MKTIRISLFAVWAMCIISCNNDDDTTPQDPIIGAWEILSVDGNQLDNCQLQSFLEFTSNANWSNPNFALSNGPTSSCSLSSIETGTWVNIGSSNYNIIAMNGNVTEVSLIFSNNQNTFRLFIADQDTGITYSRILNNDPIIGKWKLTASSINGIQEEVNQCRANTNVSFFVNNSTYAEEYGLNSGSSECILEGETLGSWQNASNGFYLDTTDGASNEFQVDFSNNQNTFTITIEAMIGDTPLVVKRTYDRVLE